MKTNKPRKAAAVPFCRIKIRSMFSYNGVKYIKFAPKKGMTPTGTIIELTDATLVTAA